MEPLDYTVRLLFALLLPSECLHSNKTKLSFSEFIFLFSFVCGGGETITEADSPQNKTFHTSSLTWSLPRWEYKFCIRVFFFLRNPHYHKLPTPLLWLRLCSDLLLPSDSNVALGVPVSPQ